MLGEIVSRLERLERIVGYIADEIHLDLSADQDADRISISPAFDVEVARVLDWAEQ